MVSDEFVLNPDLITQGKFDISLWELCASSWEYQFGQYFRACVACFCPDRLQGLLKFLEEQSTPEHPWQWKVHCKSQKKLKELGR